MFTSDHVRTLAHWAETLGLVDTQTQLYGVYHKMTTTRDTPPAEVHAVAMDAIQIIQTYEPDREMFYRTMRAWGIN